MTEPIGAEPRRPGDWAENVDPALAALWDSGVIAPLEAAREALHSAERAENRGPSLDSALDRVGTARDSVLAAADSVDDDESLRRELISLAETLTDVSAHLYGLVGEAEPGMGAMSAQAARLEAARRRLERVLG